MNVHIQADWQKNVIAKSFQGPSYLKNWYTLIINLFGKNCGVLKIVNSKVFINKV